MIITHKKDTAALSFGMLALTMFLGTFSYMVTLILALAGFGVASYLGLSMPVWSYAVAFAVGMPLGAALEYKVTKQHR